ncbi:MAG: hypothetical protein HYV28_15610 [Ignavibacteriales bacterium]|nr:hypothetical protein [Ignavibacteriales bacterium]
MKILKLLPRAIFGKHLSDVNVTYKQCNEIQIRYKKSAIIHIDGEIITEQAREVRITVDEKVVRLGMV